MPLQMSGMPSPTKGAMQSESIGAADDKPKRKPPTCSHCHEPGHNKSKCPRK